MWLFVEVTLDLMLAHPSLEDKVFTKGQKKFTFWLFFCTHSSTNIIIQRFNLASLWLDMHHILTLTHVNNLIRWDKLQLSTHLLQCLDISKRKQNYKVSEAQNVLHNQRLKLKLSNSLHWNSLLIGKIINKHTKTSNLMSISSWLLRNFFWNLFDHP